MNSQHHHGVSVVRPLSRGLCVGLALLAAALLGNIPVAAAHVRVRASSSSAAGLISVSRSLGSLLLTTTIEPNGFSDAVRDRQRDRLLGGMSVDYRAGRVIVYDASKKLIQTMSFTQAERISAFRELALGKLQFSDANGPLPFARGTLSPMKLTRQIDGVAAEAWEYQLGGVLYRLWYPVKAPRVPAADARIFAQQLPAGGAALAGKVALLAEPFDGKSFVAPKVAPRVRSIAVAVAQRALLLPHGLHRGKLFKSSGLSFAHSSSVPARVVRLSVNLLQIHGINPLVAYWGTLASPSSAALRANLDHRITTFYIKAPYVTSLSQYGVHAGAMAQPSISIAAAPFFDIGNSPTSATIIGHAISMASAELDRFGDPAWTMFNQDSVPVVVMLVSTGDVATSTVDGYHLALPARGFAGALGIAGVALSLLASGPAGLLTTFDPFLPMIISPVVPFIVSKVPAGGSTSSNADGAGPTLTHEFNETATDPWGPEVGWADPTKTPFLQANEIGDICSTHFAPVGPFTDTTRLNGMLVSTYWSNRDHGCVPESRPALTVLGPSTNQTLHPGLSIAVSARCTDRITGIILPVTWLVNGVPTPESPPGHLPPPPHAGETVQAMCQSGSAVSFGPRVTIVGG